MPETSEDEIESESEAEDSEEDPPAPMRICVRVSGFVQGLCL